VKDNQEMACKRIFQPQNLVTQGDKYDSQFLRTGRLVLSPIAGKGMNQTPEIKLVRGRKEGYTEPGDEGEKSKGSEN